MDVDRYLERIGIDGPLVPTSENLRRLHLQHLLHVPFENLDIHLDRRFTIETSALFDKIVARHRGGFCYELNGLFGWLLGGLGFEVRLLSARVVQGDGGLSPDFSHLTLLVELEERWLADVGFGDNFREPLRLDSTDPQADGQTTHRIVPESFSTYTLERLDSDEWAPQYVFTTRPRRLEEFEPRCVFYQTSPDSHFRHKRVCTLATTGGRLTLAGLSLIESADGRRTETELADEAEWRRQLKKSFGVEL